MHVFRVDKIKLQKLTEKNISISKLDFFLSGNYISNDPKGLIWRYSD